MNENRRLVIRDLDARFVVFKDVADECLEGIKAGSILLVRSPTGSFKLRQSGDYSLSGLQVLISTRSDLTYGIHPHDVREELPGTPYPENAVEVMF
ncbi:MAG: hypothetical protein BGO94_00150 [Micrococcales bacterium 72-143]|nr:MAG: hypothetical protein BGO94_00150 [Micrococcales bacterium 72-143]